VSEIDRKEKVNMSLSLNDLRNNYAIMYDTITKNLEKINNPRSQVKSVTQHLESCPKPLPLSHLSARLPCFSQHGRLSIFHSTMKLRCVKPYTLLFRAQFKCIVFCAGCPAVSLGHLRSVGLIACDEVCAVPKLVMARVVRGLAAVVMKKVARQQAVGGADLQVSVRLH
jgi:hypothetical protein